MGTQDKHSRITQKIALRGVEWRGHHDPQLLIYQNPTLNDKDRSSISNTSYLSSLGSKTI